MYLNIVFDDIPPLSNIAAAAAAVVALAAAVLISFSSRSNHSLQLWSRW